MTSLKSVAILFALAASIVNAATYSLGNYMTPFWDSDTMFNESVLMVSDSPGLPKVRLLFSPTAILSVRDASLDITYTEGVDWTFANDTLTLLAGSSAASLTHTQMYPSVEGGTMPKVGGGYVLWQEGHYFHDRQLWVTYTHAKNLWNGPVPQYAGSKFFTTLSKLRAGQPVKIVLIGNSITAGANASGVMGTAPNMPAYGELFVEYLRSVYASAITLKNVAVGGMNSSWGASNVHSLVTVENPDLVVISFGMNDGTGGMDPVSFQRNIQAIMNDVKGTNPLAEFILIATTLANPETFYAGQQVNYGPKLKELAGRGVVVVDMTTVHQELMKGKLFRDMTGNNINHPNDFLHRWYAQQVAGLLFNADSAHQDTTPPAALNAPETLFVSHNTVALSWGAAEDAESGIDRYRVYRDSALAVEIDSGSALGWNDSSVQEGTSYRYQVTAINRTGLESVRSPATAVTTLFNLEPPLPLFAYAAPGDSFLRVRFDKALEQASAETPANYADNLNIGIRGASLLDSGMTVSLLLGRAVDTADHGLVLFMNSIRSIRMTAMSPETLKVLPFGCAGYWPLYENHGSLANDVTASQRNGTLQGGAAWCQGRKGSGLAFNGLSSLVAVKDSLFLPITDNFTVSLWVNPSATRPSTAESNSGTAGVSSQRYALFPAMGDAAFGMGHAGAGLSVGVNGISVFEHTGYYLPSPLVYDAPISGWTHIALVYENKQPKLYVNGAFVRAGVTSGKIVHPCLTMGGSSYGWYQGTIDEVSLFPYRLSDEDISFLAGDGFLSHEAGKNATGSPMLTINPNPFAHQVTIGLKGNAVLRVFDLSGRCVADLSDQANRTVIWKPNRMASGIYIVSAKIHDKVFNKVVLLQK